MIQEFYIKSKYHLAVSKRLFDNYQSYSDKRLIVGVINELAKATSNIIKAYLIHEKRKKLRDFVMEIASKYMDKETLDNLLKILEIEKAQRISPVEFSKEGTIILLVGGKYRFLTISRLSDFIKSCENAVNRLSSVVRQV